MHEIKQGTIGFLASAGSLAVSFSNAVEIWLRIASLIIGIAVGCVSIWSIVRNTRRRDAASRRDNDPAAQ
jgi:ABC-type nickel/cobalt efflux system permease component RcnA